MYLNEDTDKKPSGGVRFLFGIGYLVVALGIALTVRWFFPHFHRFDLQFIAEATIAVAVLAVIIGLWIWTKREQV